MSKPSLNVNEKKDVLQSKQNKETKQAKHDREDREDPFAGMEGLKAKIGDKLIDLDDVRLRKPHSVRPRVKNNAGGLLETGDHRPVDRPIVDRVVTDVRLSTCYSILGKIPRCRLTLDDGSSWTRVPKDILLGSKWYKKVFMDYRTANTQKAAKLDIHVVNEVRVGDKLKDKSWKNVGYGMWIKKDAYIDTESITGMDVLFGRMAVEPRQGWDLIEQSLKVSGKHLENEELTEESRLKKDWHIYDTECYLTVRKGRKKEPVQRTTSLSFVDHKFKILQIADIHLVAGFGRCRDPWPDIENRQKNKCLGDLKTIQFVERVLDLEKPNFVIFTGDQVFGSESKDFETAIFKAVKPVIDRKIPYAMVMGNHDSEGSLSREQIYQLLDTLPYSISKAGPEEISGVGNYHLTVTSDKDTENKDLILYLLDSHSYTHSKVPGYDYIKEDQKEFVRMEYENETKLWGDIPMAMGFFHIPLPEYREYKNEHGQARPMVGQYKEGCTAPIYNSHMFELFKEIGVSVVSVGHDHCNDYCLDYNGVWLCYGGGGGEGGYAGYGGTTRRLRVFEIDNERYSITSWKRLQTNPEEIFDEQILQERQQE
ncbi:hypothetical protein FOA43_002783 [Brettanomyces nanus]|uniref:Calcineurin-like phosphoesterase domain-containing protein n=1 Tax=Eeniella nana TaxID=13502 RepID=A0A875S6T7_EENNA|nr:uncharacterized protein FOA43_002783 [Brettanomyces nanus]QPG75429.1 hypothetical protein FOA43_002783 [Brettanomyces nanus]